MMRRAKRLSLMNDCNMDATPLNKDIVTLIDKYIIMDYMTQVLTQLKKSVRCVEDTITYLIVCDGQYYPGFCCACKRYDYVMMLTDEIKTCDDCLYNVYYVKANELGLWL
jgi:hypothetical protein